MTVIQKKRDPAAVWAVNNPILADGEHGYEEDTDRFKIGDGVTRYMALPYYISDGELKTFDNKWSGTQYFQEVAVKKGNKIDLIHADLHPSARSRLTYFDGNSHPIGSFFPGSTPAARLANAQVQFPFLTSENDEADWVAYQAAILAVTSYPRGWGLLNGQDWRQYGTARLTQPLGTVAMINRPITKAANTNQNLVIGSETSQGARMDYTGGDGGRMFDFDKDSVGSTLDIKNLVLNGAGVRLKGPYRGDIRIGNGVLAIDTPHPAIMCEDADKATTQVGVVGLVVEHFIAHGCYGAVWQHSSTADITTIRDTRAICNMDVAYSINGSTDAILQNLDATGLVDTAVALGSPYIKISAALDTTNNINLDDIRYGSEAFTAGTGTALKNFGPTREYLLLGETSGAQVQMGTITLRRNAFRTPAVVSSTVGKAAIKMAAKCILDVDKCDFGEFNDFLIDEAYRQAGGFYYSGPQQCKWGDKNTIDAGHTQPIFSDGGQNFYTTNRHDPTKIDSRAFADPGDAQNLVSTDLSTWGITNGTLSAATGGGLGGSQYYTVTKTAAGCLLFKDLAVVQGTTYHFGIAARKGTMHTMRFRAGIGTNPVPVDTRQIQVDGDFVYFVASVQKVSASGNMRFSFYLDNDELTPASPAAGFGTIDVGLPFVNSGPVARLPRTNLRLTKLRAAPATPIEGTHYLADGVNWDPKGRALAKPYEVMYDGVGYEPVTAPEPTGGAAAPTVFESNNPASTSTGFNVNTDQPLAAHANIPAAQLHVGDRIKIRAQGNIDTQITPGNFNLRTRVNGVTVVTSSLVTTGSTAAAVAAPWQLDFDVIITAIGAAGSMRIVGQQVTASGNTNARLHGNVFVDIAVDLSAGFLVTITGQTSTSSATNTIRHHASMVEKAV